MTIVTFALWAVILVMTCAFIAYYADSLLEFGKCVASDLVDHMLDVML